MSKVYVGYRLAHRPIKLLTEQLLATAADLAATEDERFWKECARQIAGAVDELYYSRDGETPLECVRRAIRNIEASLGTKDESLKQSHLEGDCIVRLHQLDDGSFLAEIDTFHVEHTERLGELLCNAEPFGYWDDPDLVPANVSEEELQERGEIWKAIEDQPGHRVDILVARTRLSQRDLEEIWKRFPGRTERIAAAAKSATIETKIAELMIEMSDSNAQRKYQSCAFTASRWLHSLEGKAYHAAWRAMLHTEFSPDIPKPWEFNPHLRGTDDL